MDMNALNSQASGGDLSAGVEARQLDADPGDKSMGPNFRIAFTYMLSIRKPIIAAVNGACAGLGMSIALLCDLRFASENARFITAFSQRGLVAEHGQSWILPRVVGPARALDLLWSSRRVDAEESLQIGLVDRVHAHDDLLDEAKAYINGLAENAAPMSLMFMKQQVYKHLNTDLEEAMKESTRLMNESLERDDFKEGVSSFIEKRPSRESRSINPINSRGWPSCLDPDQHQISVESGTIAFVNQQIRMEFQMVRIIVSTLLLLLAFGAQAGDAEAGKAKAATCAACHGQNGISPNEQWPNLAGQKEGYLVKQITAFRDGDRVDPMMAPMVQPLTDEDIENLATYFSGLSICP